MPLTPKQQAFIEHYLTCWNASEAARRAGYSLKSAHVLGHDLLKHPEVTHAIKQRLDDLKATADEVLVLLTDHQRATLDDFIGTEGQIDVAKARDSGKMHLLKKYKTTRRTIKDMTEDSVEIELHDPQAAAVWLGKHHGLFVDRSSVDTTSTVNQTVKVDLSGLSDDQLKLLASSLKD